MKKIVFFFIILSQLALLFSCSNELEKDEDPKDSKIQSSLSFKSNNNQEFEIINYYQEFLDFLKNAKEKPTNLEDIYKQVVLESLRKNGFGYDDLSEWMFTTPTDVEALEESMDILIDKQVLLNESIKEALLESSQLLPGENKTIHVLPAIPEFKDSMAEANNVGGFVWKKDSMLILIDPSFLEKDLKYIVAHEYHHTVLYELNEVIPYTLLERSITEGKADAFAKMIFPNTDAPWTEPISTRDDEEVWDIFKNNIDSTDSSLIQDFTYGNSYYGIPQWSTYNIGTQVMDNFLDENPNFSVEEWTGMPAKDIFLMSKYSDK